MPTRLSPSGGAAQTDRLNPRQTRPAVAVLGLKPRAIRPIVDMRQPRQKDAVIERPVETNRADP